MNQQKQLKKILPNNNIGKGNRKKVIIPGVL